MKTQRQLISIILLVGVGCLSVIVYHSETKERKLKEDLIELSKIKYGLFSIDEWKKILANIITKKVEEFNLDEADKPEMKEKISGLLHVLVSDLREAYREENSRELFGFVKDIGASFFGIFDTIENRIPEFTEKIIAFMNDPNNRRRIRGFIINKLNDYADKTFSKIDYGIHDKVIAEHGFENRETAVIGLNMKIDELEKVNQPYKIGLIALGILTGIFIVFSNSISKYEYGALTVICFMFLLAGLLLPMIEIDARVSEMSFNLLGEPVSFQDQVLYYKSKSILEVVNLMMVQQRLDLLFVGILVLTFSVLFPVTKLVLSLVYLNSRELIGNKFIQFMIFKTGKWSMADVMVIAIFMAYIGFSGIITEQLKQIENITQNIDILTTNKSSLRTGFFVFSCFALLSLLTSHKLQYQLGKKEVDE